MVLYMGEKEETQAHILLPKQTLGTLQIDY